MKPKHALPKTLACLALCCLLALGLLPGAVLAQDAALPAGESASALSSSQSTEAESGAPADENAGSESAAPESDESSSAPSQAGPAETTPPSSPEAPASSAAPAAAMAEEETVAPAEGLLDEAVSTQAADQAGSFSELQGAITSAGGTPTTIQITADFDITATLTIAAGQDITLESDASPRTLARFADKPTWGSPFQGEFFLVQGKLTLQNITFEGNGDIDTNGDMTNDPYAWAKHPFVTVQSSGELTTKDGAVLQNNVNGDMGSSIATAVGVDGGTFNMLGGKLWRNHRSIYSGGAVHVFNSGVFNMRGGIIARNKTYSNGSGIIATNGGVVNLYAGQVVDNHPSDGPSGYSQISVESINIFGGTIGNEDDQQMWNILGDVVMHGGTLTGGHKVLQTNNPSGKLVVSGRVAIGQLPAQGRALDMDLVRTIEIDGDLDPASVIYIEDNTDAIRCEDLVATRTDANPVTPAQAAVFRLVPNARYPRGLHGVVGSGGTVVWQYEEVAVTQPSILRTTAEATTMATAADSDDRYISATGAAARRIESPYAPTAITQVDLAPLRTPVKNLSTHILTFTTASHCTDIARLTVSDAHHTRVSVPAGEAVAANNITLPMADVPYMDAAKWQTLSGAKAWSVLAADLNTTLATGVNASGVPALPGQWPLVFTAPGGTTVTATVTVTASNYTLTFDFNGAGAPVYRGQPYASTFKAPAAARTGYTLKGWKDTGSGSKWNFTTGTMPAKDLTLKADWSLNRHTVTYLSEGAVLDTRKVDYGGAIPYFAPTRAGYSFKHWAQPKSADTPWNFKKGTMPDKDLTLVAQWTADTVTPGPGPSSSTPSSSRPPAPPPATSRSESLEAQSPASSSQAASSSSAAAAAPAPTTPAPPTGGDGGTPATTTPQQAQFDAQSGNPLLDVANGNVPMGGFGHIGAWSLLNLLLALGGLGISIVLLVGVLRRKREPGARTAFDAVLRLISLLGGLLPGLLFLLLEDVAGPMVWINQYTLLFTAIVALQVVAVIVRRAMKARQDDENEEETAPV